MNVIHQPDRHAVLAALAAWHPGMPSALYVREPVTRLRARLRDVKALVTDYDGTCTAKNTFRALDAHLTALYGTPRSKRTLRNHLDYVVRVPSGKNPEPGERFRKWLEREGPYTKTDRAAAENGLLLSNVIVFLNAGITRDVLDGIGRTAPPRAGLHRLVDATEYAIVLSAGIERTIETFLETNGLSRVDLLAALCLEFDDAGRIVDSDHLMFPSVLKGDLAVRMQARTGYAAEQLLCLGDTPFDVPLFIPGAVRIGLLPPESEDAHGHEDRLKRFDEYFEAVDGMVVGPDLTPLADLLDASRQP